jgi:hypothetical protein
MDPSANTEHVEVAVSYRFAREHGWVVNAISGFLSAYYMEDPRFRLDRRYDELDTGTIVWLCHIETDMPMKRLIKRLTRELPENRVTQCKDVRTGMVRYVIDAAEAD